MDIIIYNYINTLLANTRAPRDSQGKVFYGNCLLFLKHIYSNGTPILKIVEYFSPNSTVRGYLLVNIDDHLASFNLFSYNSSALGPSRPRNPAFLWS